jgi:Domian of unknown function (DUF4952)
MMRNIWTTPLFLGGLLTLAACSNPEPTARTSVSVAPNSEANVEYLEQKVPGMKPACSDVLSTWKTKPANLTFVGCADSRSAQVRTLEYRYSVVGSKAKPVEKFLASTFGMAPLAFACCGWEPRPIEPSGQRLGVYRNAEGFQYQISMGSGETLEKDWSKIPTFLVTIELLLDVV